MKNIILIFTIISFITYLSCKEKKDFIEISIGKGDNPADGRKAIKFHENLTSIYLKEINNNFEYYKFKISKKEWEHIKNLVIASDELKETNIPPNVMISDGQKMDIIYSINNKNSKIRYELGFLPKNLNATIDNIFEKTVNKDLKKCDKIKFNSDLLD